MTNTAIRVTKLTALGTSIAAIAVASWNVLGPNAGTGNHILQKPLDAAMANLPAHQPSVAHVFVGNMLTGAHDGLEEMLPSIPSDLAASVEKIRTEMADYEVPDLYAIGYTQAIEGRWTIESLEGYAQAYANVSNAQVEAGALNIAKTGQLSETADATFAETAEAEMYTYAWSVMKEIGGYPPTHLMATLVQDDISAAMLNGVAVELGFRDIAPEDRYAATPTAGEYTAAMIDPERDLYDEPSTTNALSAIEIMQQIDAEMDSSNAQALDIEEEHSFSPM